MGAELVLSAVNERGLGDRRPRARARPPRAAAARRAGADRGWPGAPAARPARRTGRRSPPERHLPDRGARLPARLGGGRPHVGARPRGRRRRGAGQQTAITSKLTLVRNGVILFSPNGSMRVLWTKMRGPPRRWTSTSAATSSGLDEGLDARRGLDRAALEVERQLGAGRRGGEGDVVEADAGLLDRAVVVGADQLAVLGDAQLEHGLRGVAELAGGDRGAAERGDERGQGDGERGSQKSGHASSDAPPAAVPGTPPDRPSSRGSSMPSLGV